MNRRSFFRSLFTAAALAYCPGVLRAPAVRWETVDGFGGGSNVICSGAVTVGDIKTDFAEALEAYCKFKDERGVLLRGMGWPECPEEAVLRE